MKKLGQMMIKLSLILLTFSGVFLITSVSMESSRSGLQTDGNSSDTESTATETIPPSTPLATVTPIATLRPPPTFEPPTLTPMPSTIPTLTTTPTVIVEVDLPGVHGLETPTPSSTPGCEVRKDWALTYTVQANDALEQIANQYGTNAWALAEANCLEDMNLIQLGQKLRVPGDAHPVAPAYECVAWELLTPMDRAFDIDGKGQLTFNWRGPVAERNLVRVYKPDGTIWEKTVDLRQNLTINLAEELPDGGVYTWQVFPLNLNFVQIPCPESPVWQFHKNDGMD